MTLNHTVEEYAIALRDARGMVTHAATRLGVSRQAVTQRMAKHPSLREVREDAREAMTDEAEVGLYESIVAREAWAICFYLKTQGKDRGYVERTEDHRQVSGDIRITIEAVDDRSDPRAR